MSVLYVIGVGGTGTKCVEAFIHLCAMGVVEDMGDVEIRIVDIDESGGNFERMSSVMKNYQKTRERVRLPMQEAPYVFAPNLRFGQKSLWSARTEDNYGNNDTLDQRMVRNPMTPEEQLLMRSLYSRAEREMELDVGVRGVPRVGALLCAQNLDLEQDEFWEELFGEAAYTRIQAENAKVILVGSLFGGTGASCTPTIARALSSWAAAKGLGGLKIGLCMMLPYFLFGGSAASDDEVRARADYFIVNTKAALLYYKKIGILDFASNVYILGDEVTAERQVKFAIGKSAQRNDAMPVELVASAAIKDFLYDNRIDKKIKYVKSNAADDVVGGYNWKQFPDGVLIRERMDRLLRFSMLFNYHCFSMAQTNDTDLSKNAVFNTFFGIGTFTSRKSREDWLDAMQPVFDYTESFMEWVRQIKATGMNMLDPNDVLSKRDLKNHQSSLDISAIAGRADAATTTKGARWDMVFGKLNAQKPTATKDYVSADFLNAVYRVSDFV